MRIECYFKTIKACVSHVFTLVSPEWCALCACVSVCLFYFSFFLSPIPFSPPLGCPETLLWTSSIQWQILCHKLATNSWWINSRSFSQRFLPHCKHTHAHSITSSHKQQKQTFLPHDGNLWMERPEVVVLQRFNPAISLLQLMRR